MAAGMEGEGELGVSWMGRGEPYLSTLPFASVVIDAPSTNDNVTLTCIGNEVTTSIGWTKIGSRSENRPPSPSEAEAAARLIRQPGMSVVIVHGASTVAGRHYNMPHLHPFLPHCGYPFAGEYWESRQPL